jgi:hypothetical protein
VSKTTNKSGETNEDKVDGTLDVAQAVELHSLFSAESVLVSEEGGLYSGKLNPFEKSTHP